MKTFIAAIMIMGGKREPFLPACIESIRDAVDLLVLNDNSQDPCNPNMDAVKRSTLFKEDKVHVIPSEFKGFGYCRSLCLDYLKEIYRPGMWVLYIDTDEVHPPSIVPLTRDILPCLPPNVGILDGYFYQFFQSMEYYLSLERRHNLFFRFNQEIRWEGRVHERPVNLWGRREALPYRYFHYGYLIKPEEIVDKWKMYACLGDEQIRAQSEEPDDYFRKDAARALKFRGRHPTVAMEYLEKIEKENQQYREYFNGLVRENESFNRIGKNLKVMNFELRMKARIFQFALKFLHLPRLLRGFWRMLNTAGEDGHMERIAINRQHVD